MPLVDELQGSEKQVSTTAYWCSNKTILTTKVSIPRNSIHACDRCGHRLSRGSECISRGPHSTHVDQDNYLQQLSQVHTNNNIELKKMLTYLFGFDVHLHLFLD